MDGSPEQWITREQVIAARQRYEATIPGWQRPWLYGVGLVDAHGVPQFPFVCRGDHPLPAVILAGVCGHRGGAGSYALTIEQLDEAIARLRPAEACAEFDHPNLAAWREVRRSIAGVTRPSVVAVFDADPNAPTDDPNVLALRSEADQPS